MKNVIFTFTCAAMFAFAWSSLAAGNDKLSTPDFTKGDIIPAGAKQDWNLGAIGARGWMFCDKLVTSDARQVAITKVEKGSPANGLLAVGDVLLGVGGKPFSCDPRTELGKAITVAESDAGGGKLALTRWRAGQTEEIVLKLAVLGNYSATAPYACPKSKRILEQGCKLLAAQMADPAYAKKHDPIPRALNALALLASGDPAYLPLVKMLEAPSLEARYGACQALATVRGAAAAVPALQKTFRHEDLWLRVHAAEALAAIEASTGLPGTHPDQMNPHSRNDTNPPRRLRWEGLRQRKEAGRPARIEVKASGQPTMRTTAFETIRL